MHVLGAKISSYQKFNLLRIIKAISLRAYILIRTIIHVSINTYEMPLCGIQYIVKISQHKGITTYIQFY